MDARENVSNKKRLIDADVLWCKLESEHWYDNADRDEIALPLVDEAPIVDAVEVVRCLECKHKGWVQEPCHGKSVDYCRIWECYLGNLNTTFCSYGERRR